MTRDPIRDDPDAIAAIEENRELQRLRQKYLRLKGFEPKEYLTTSALKQEIDEALRSSMKK